MKAGDLVEGFHFDVMLVEPIADSRLFPDMDYCQAVKHFFRRKSYEGNDFMTNNPDSCDAIIEAPEKHYKAQLIDNVWWWVNECAQCCGHARNWMGSECEKHNVCRTCGIPRSELNEAVYGGRHGWQCASCEAKEKLAAKIKALQAVQEKIESGEYGSWDYLGQDNIKCPHCDNEYEPCTADGVPEGEETCDVCDGKFSIEPEYSITYSTQIIGDRVTLDSVAQEQI